MQSFEPRELVALGRDHRFGDGRAAVERTLAAGFTTSVDFIIGIPGGGPGANLNPTIDLLADHLSIYELTIEERTSFGQRVRDGRLVPLSEDLLTELYVSVHDRLTAEGYEHYEISSYARPGRRAIHNSRYWAGAPYLGLGVGAASLEVLADGAAIRATNPRRWVDYAAGVPPEVSHVPADEMATDRLWLAMRTRDGVGEGALPADLAAALVAGGLAERRDGRICPTLRGFLMADTIAAQIVQAR